MPRTRSLAFSELKIGILAVVAIVIAASVVFMLSGQGGFFWQRYSLKVRLPNAAGLKSGAPVRLAGVEIGAVTGLDFVGAKVDVTVRVSRDQQSRITNTSTATLGAMGLLGQATVDITPSTSGQPIQEWGYIPTGSAAGQLSDVAAAATEGMEEVTGLLREIRSGRGSVGQFITNRELYDQMNRLVASAQQVVDSLNKGQGTIGDLLKNKATAQSLQASIDNLRAITAGLSAGQGPLGALLHDEQMAGSLKSTASNLSSLTEGLQHGQGSAGKLLKDEALYNRLDALTGRLDDLITRLNAGEGTAGQFLKNRELYDNMNGAIKDLRQLVADIRKDPKKFLTMKFTVF